MATLEKTLRPYGPKKETSEDLTAKRIGQPLEILHGDLRPEGCVFVGQPITIDMGGLEAAGPGPHNVKGVG